MGPKGSKPGSGKVLVQGMAPPLKKRAQHYIALPATYSDLEAAILRVFLKPGEVPPPFQIQVHSESPPYRLEPVTAENYNPNRPVSSYIFGTPDAIAPSTPKEKPREEQSSQSSPPPSPTPATSPASSLAYDSSDIPPVEVVHLTGTVQSFNIPYETTLGRLRQLIEEGSGIPTDQQRLIFLAEQRDDDRKRLCDMGVDRDNHRFHLVLKLRGD